MIALDVIVRNAKANGKRLYSSTNVKMKRLCDMADGHLGPTMSMPKRSNGLEALIIFEDWGGLKNLGLHCRQV